MTKKIVAYGCWSNENHIAIENGAGIIHPRLFTTKEAAEKFYKNIKYPICTIDDPIVKVTVEIIELS